ncbi:hypothetical protein HY440_02990 [Candidatus Microgenomates bacterium]|nr:hypothetical protein [Candidatus Microgenomates bacterium]
MLVLILILFIVLWFLGFISLPPLATVLFFLLGHPITVFDVLVFLGLLAAIGLLPGFFRFVAAVLLLLLILSFLGLITITGFSSVVALVIIFAIIYYLLTGGP